MIDKFGLALLSMFGIGHIKYAPGTIASFVTCMFYLLLISIKVNFIFVIFIYIILLIYSIILIDKLSHHFKEKDPKEIVIDEFLGQSIPILYIYLVIHIENAYGQLDKIVLLIFLAFVSFRFFDILKIFPINIIDKKMKNALGVVLDDIVAGLYSAIIIFIILLILLNAK